MQEQTARKSAEAWTNMAHAFTRAANAFERVAAALEESNRIAALDQQNRHPRGPRYDPAEHGSDYKGYSGPYGVGEGPPF